MDRGAGEEENGGRHGIPWKYQQQEARGKGFSFEKKKRVSNNRKIDGDHFLDSFATVLPCLIHPATTVHASAFAAKESAKRFLTNLVFFRPRREIAGRGRGEMRVGAARSTLLLMRTDIHLFFLFSLLSLPCSSFSPANRW